MTITMSSATDPWLEYRSRKRIVLVALGYNSGCWRWCKARPSSLGAAASGTAHQSRRSFLGNSFCHLLGRLVCSGYSFLAVEIPEVRASVYRRVRWSCFPAKEVLLLQPSHRKRSGHSWTVTDRKAGAFWRIGCCLHFGCFSRQSTSYKEQQREGYSRPEGQSDIGAFPLRPACFVFTNRVGFCRLELWLRSSRFSRARLSRLSADVTS